MNKSIDSPKYNDIPKYNDDVKPKLIPKDQLNVISQFFINNPNGKYNKYEMEAKFGTRGIKPITKIDYDNVVRKIKRQGQAETYTERDIPACLLKSSKAVAQGRAR